MNTGWLKVMVAVLFILLTLQGCASISRGVTEAILESSGRKEDTRVCYVRGRPIDGIKTYISNQETATKGGKSAHRILKVLMVHGVGSHQPGYSTRMDDWPPIVRLAQRIEMLYGS